MNSGPMGKCALADGRAHFVFVFLYGSKVTGNFSQTPHLNKTPREVCGGHGKKKGLTEGRKSIILKSETLPCNFLMPTVGTASCTMGTGSFLGGKGGRGVTLTTHPHLVPRSWKSRAIPLLLLRARVWPATGWNLTLPYCWKVIACGIYVFVLIARQPPGGQDLLIQEVSRSHTTTHHSW